ncbi:LPP20 family lipoprotein [Vibrio sp. CAU 1672]|uniref:LPP20 family lipoprotein n=1 Tax=Vibrio sp. CAU 1672 TaxID=3032594 RepID=UPI0023D9B3FC|nr:LPP20 family lipoprotein [Vibrio sp. CAU 1672]MDF2155762.1 LPP20 family lipoprotein [Vibrio sp. CAU 1672]
MVQKSVLAIAALACLLPCTSSASGNSACSFLPKSPMPEWIISPLPSDKDYIYGYGVASSPKDSVMQLRKNSSSDARSNLSETLQVRVQSELSKEILRRDDGHKVSINKDIKSLIQSKSDAILVSSEVVSVWLDRESCNLWTKVRIDRASAQQSEKLVLNSALTSMDEALKEISNKLDNVKKETSKDPKKELQNQGLSYTGESFAQTLYRGDQTNIQLYIDAGMNFSDAIDPRGESFYAMFYRISPKRLEKSLDVLTKSFSAKELRMSYFMKHALYRGDVKKTKILVEAGADINEVYKKSLSVYVPRKLSFQASTPLCVVNSRISYFETYPDDDVDVKDYIDLKKYLVSLGAKSKGAVVTHDSLTYKRYPEKFNCKTNTRSQVIK